MTAQITGATAAEIVESVRDLVDRGVLSQGEALPPVRVLADALGINRNTAVAAYRQLSQAGVTTAHGRGGTRVAGAQRTAQDGFATDTVLRDIASGNPNPAFIPPLAPALASLADRTVLYGERAIDAQLEEWALNWFSDDLAQQRVHLALTNGAVDAIERLLAQALVRDDAVGLEDPCFLASIHTVRLGGYRAVPIPVDDEGMTVAGVAAAIDAGVRAIICTPRAQNPTGVTMSERRAAELRRVLAEHPYVLLIEDDHFSLLSPEPAVSLISPAHRRFAVIRSVSKFLGPDMSLAMVATDRSTATRLGERLSPGTTWVSHILQRLTLAQLTSTTVMEQLERAKAHYAARNARFAELLVAAGMTRPALGGLSLWVQTPLGAESVANHLMRRGWLARPGSEFQLTASASEHLRLTVHALTDLEQDQLVADIVAASATN